MVRRARRHALKLCPRFEAEDCQIVIGLIEIVAGLLLAVFSGPLAKASIALNKRTLGIELPFEWARIGGVIVGALLSFAGVLKLLGLPPL